MSLRPAWDTHLEEREKRERMKKEPYHAIELLACSCLFLFCLEQLGTESE